MQFRQNSGYLYSNPQGKLQIAVSTRYEVLKWTAPRIFQHRPQPIPIIHKFHRSRDSWGSHSLEDVVLAFQSFDSRARRRACNWRFEKNRLAICLAPPSTHDVPFIS